MPGTFGRIPTPPAPDVGDPAATGTAALLASYPWEQTPLGAQHSWDPALRTLAELVVACPMPMALAYGDDLVLIYNDAYAPLVGAQHPAAFGQAANGVLTESWHQSGLGDVLTSVYRDGRPHLGQETTLPVFRAGSGLIEHGVFAHSHSPVRDGSGRVVGVLTVAAETTQVIQQLKSLSELTTALSATLTLDDVARVALRYALDSFDADWAAFSVDDGPGWRSVRRVRGEVIDEADERLPPLWRRWPAEHPGPLAVAAGTAHARFTGDEHPLHASAIDRHDEKIRALAALPLRTTSLRGSFGVGYRDPHSWSSPERALLAAGAELIAQAAERARRFETQHGTAQLLQRSMLPENLPDLPQLRVAARYEAGVDGNAAGGDFYDAFVLPDGCLGIVLGDVAGHDVQAAARMGQVRAALRALALNDSRPDRVLTGVDRLVASLGAEGGTDELFVTVVFGVLDPDGARMTLSSAGHPAPLLRRCTPEGEPTARYLDLPTGTPLGLGGHRVSSTVEFVPGDTLLLYSDGVIERRRHSLSAGLAALAGAVAAAGSGDPRALCAVATAAVGGTTEDDVAIIAVEHVRTPSRSARMQVPAEPTAPSRVRRWMSRQLTQWQVPEQVVSAAVLCTSELTTNALLHAGTAARVEIDLSTERLLVSVADSGTRGTVTRAQTDTLSSRGRGLGLIEHLSDAWGTDPTVRGSTVWFEMLIPEQ